MRLQVISKLKFLGCHFDVNLIRSISTSPVIVEKSNCNNITTIILNRAHVKNAIDSNCAKYLASAFEEFEKDPDSKVAVLCSSGDSFCSGADLKAISRGDLNELDSNGNGPLGPTRFELSKPVIAAVNGAAVAGGLELAIWCDLRVVEEDAYFGVFCRKWGVPLIDGGTVRLPRLVGLSRAMDLILTGRSVSAREAFEIGLANRLVPKGKARIEAEKLAKHIVEFPQFCMLTDRKSAYEGFSLPIKEALRREIEKGKDVVLKNANFMEDVTKFKKSN